MAMGTCRRCKRTNVYLPTGSEICEGCDSEWRQEALRIVPPWEVRDA